MDADADESPFSYEEGENLELFEQAVRHCFAHALVRGGFDEWLEVAVDALTIVMLKARPDMNKNRARAKMRVYLQKTYKLMYDLIFDREAIRQKLS